MRVTKLNLQFFRNHSGLKVDLPLDKSVIVIRGANGSGKTSVLEALYYTSLLKSFRSTSGDDMVFWDEQYFRLEIEANSNNQEQKMEVFFGVPPYKKKVLKINEIERLADYFVGQLKTVLFTPRDLLLFIDDPGLRRNYLNRVLMQIEPGFVTVVSNFQRALRQRNALLKAYRKQVRDEELDVWDEELVKYGLPIILARHDLVSYLNDNLQQEYAKISGTEQNLQVGYLSSAGLTVEQFRESLKKSRFKDMQDGVTSKGPHRDELTATMNARNVKTSLSQGELRSLALGLKLAESAYIEHKTKVQPILLLDDVFSELDQNRQMRLIELLQNHQVFITAAEEHCLAELPNLVHVIKL